jgi:hypothetical protein
VVNALCAALASPLSSPGLKRCLESVSYSVTIAYARHAHLAEELVAAVRACFDARAAAATLSSTLQQHRQGATTNFDLWLLRVSHGVSASSMVMGFLVGPQLGTMTEQEIFRHRTPAKWSHALNNLGTGEVLSLEAKYTQIYRSRMWKCYDDVYARDPWGVGTTRGKYAPANKKLDKDWEAALSLADKALGHYAEREYGRAVVG